MRQVSPDGSTYMFSSTTGPLAKLKTGGMMLLQGFAVRDVSRVSKKPPGLVVVTKPAAITDLVANEPR